MEVYFHIADYVVMGLFLLISLGIGIYYGLIRKQKTTEEYLLGNRQMQLLPVALSMMVTYQSAISVIGVPAEVYLYNTMFLYIYVGLAVASLIQYFMIVPLMYPLRLTSAYEVRKTTTTSSIYMYIFQLENSMMIQCTSCKKYYSTTT